MVKDGIEQSVAGITPNLMFDDLMLMEGCIFDIHNLISSWAMF